MSTETQTFTDEQLQAAAIQMQKINEVKQAEIKKHQTDLVEWLNERGIEIMPMIDAIGLTVREAGYVVVFKQ
jgi:hypothetical protein